MKSISKLLLFSLFILMITLSGKAQKYAGQWVMNVAGGPANAGYSLFLGIEKYIGNSYSSLKCETGYTRNGHDLNSIPELKVKVNTFTLDIAYGYSLEKNLPHAFYINLYGGFVIGLEKFKGHVLQGILRTKSGSFISGLSLHPQAEFNLFRHFSLYIEPKGIYYFQSTQDKFQFACNLGFKYYLPLYRN